MSIAIGLDIAKEKIDYYCEGKHSQVKNTAKSIKEHFELLDNKLLIVMESTGKYHRTAHRVLENLGFQVMVINPYQSKHFAKALNLICKTDKVDARMLALFGEKMDFKATPSLTKQQELMQDLGRHIDDLKQIKQDIAKRLEGTEGFIKKSLTKTLSEIQKEIKASEAELNGLVENDKQLREKKAILMSIRGIGETTALFLLCYLRELGKVNKNEIAALSGLAPMNNDSGTLRGKRRIQGGRFDVRRHLYMPILGAATQHNPRLKKIYERLVSSGKPKKVALTACMRKLIVWSNALLSRGEYWKEEYV